MALPAAARHFFQAPLCANCIPIVFVVGLAALLAGCHHHSVGVILRPANVPSVDLPLSQVDLGASVLAEVENARLAIIAKDLVAASNDIAAAKSFAAQLPYRPSKLILPDPARAGRNRSSAPGGIYRFHAPLTDFETFVELVSAQADLLGNSEAADSHLRNIQMGIRQDLVPHTLLLLRAAANLDRARVDALKGQTLDLRTQLRGAQTALSSYSGPAHVTEAKALAATIDQALSQARTINTMLPYRPGAWLTEVVQWAGAERWNEPVR